MSVLAPALRMILVGGLLISVSLMWWLDRPNGRWIGRVRNRLLLGVPWGTLVSIGLVLAVYLGLQHGYRDWTTPLTLPYVSWSYLYPLGVLTAGFAHTGPSHLLGNLFGTVVLAPIVEYTWGHYPRRRGTSSFGSWRRNPYVRAFLLFPVAVVLTGVTTVLFHWGPLIGFSGVVFAFAGFALVRHPIVTVVALSLRTVLSTGYYAMVDPIVTATPGPSFGGPWWAGIAVEGHAFGLLLGAVLGVALFRRRGGADPPSALQLWIGTVIAGMSLTLWAIWWYGSGASFVLYRGLGVVLVVAVAILFTAAMLASNRDLLPRRLGAPTRRLGISRHRAATMVLVVALSTMAVVAIPVNLTTVETATTPGQGVSVRDYRVIYAEDVRNQNVPAIDISLLGSTTNVTTSGVIVINRDRHLWTREVSAAALGFFGYASVTVGGPTWERTVQVRRRGWVPTGGEAVYQVWLQEPGGSWQHAFASSGSMASPVIDARSIKIVANDGVFDVAVIRNEEVIDRAQIPATNESVRVGGIRFVHQETALVAMFDDTRVVVAREEEYA
ncbi:MAG: rhomboid family intramembrane serine protease [Halobacteriaceae archaeon]